MSWHPKLVATLPPLRWTWLRAEKEQGERLPPRWYALGRLAWDSDTAYFYPVPIAWLVMAYDAVTLWWDRCRSLRPTYLRRVGVIRRRAHRLGYRRGYQAGMEAHSRMMLDEIHKHFRK